MHVNRLQYSKVMHVMFDYGFGVLSFAFLALIAL